MIKNLFNNYQKILEHFFNRVDIKSSEKMMECFYNCQGTIIFTGVGKSGIVGEKIAKTMTSTGTKALFVSPINGLHGDIGIISDKDIVVFISKSGETDELLQFLSFVKNRNVKTFAWISKTDSKLGALCDERIILPVEKELCPFNLAPTTSAGIQMIFGDVLSIALMHKKEFGLASYALNHPSGSIGRKIRLKVEDIMLKDNKLPLCSAFDKLKDVLVKLTSLQCGCLLVVNKEKKNGGDFYRRGFKTCFRKKSRSYFRSTYAFTNDY